MTLKEVLEKMKEDLDLYESISVDMEKRDSNGHCMCPYDCGGDCKDYTIEIDTIKKYLPDLEKANELHEELIGCIEELIEGGACEDTICQTNYANAKKILKKINHGRN